MEHDLANQNALVTGASSGIGAATAIELARRGANVGINYHGDAEGAEKVKTQCEKFGNRSATYGADVSQEEPVDKMISEFCENFGRLDILVANAGIQLDNDFLTMELQQWEKVLAVNLTGYFLCAQRAARVFVRQGHDPSRSSSAGKILFVSSVHDKVPWPGHCNYAAAKGGIKMLMESIALELAERKIRVNAVSPGAIKTAINQEVWQDPEQAEKLSGIIPYGRVGEPAEVGRAVAWLCSDAADYVTGTSLYIDGGMTLYPSFLDNG